MKKLSKDGHFKEEVAAELLAASFHRTGRTGELVSEGDQAGHQ